MEIVNELMQFFKGADKPALQDELNKEPLFPYIIGSVPGYLDEGIKEGDPLTDEWLNTERIIVHNGKNYKTSGNYVIGEGSIKDGNLEFTNDIAVDRAKHFVAVNVDDPDDKIIVESAQLSYDYYMDINDPFPLGDNISYAGERSDGQGGTVYDPTRTNWITPDTLFVNPRGHSERRGGTVGKYTDNYGENNNIVIHDTKYEDIKTTTYMTKARWDKLGTDARTNLEFKGFTRDDFPDE